MRRIIQLVLAGLWSSVMVGACGKDEPSTPVGDESACKPGGQACEAFSECCSGTCANQVCTVCNATGEVCGEDIPCCLGLVCSNGTCNPPCSPAGAACTLASECCSNVCEVGFCEGDCRAAGEVCTADNQCCEGTCAGGVCVPPCRPDGNACALDGECCGGACTEGLCCKPPGGGCAADGECCGGFCYQSACTVTCPDTVPCADWGNRMTPYGDLCGAAQGAADELVACACAQCGEVCGGESCPASIQTWMGGPDPAGCTMCFNERVITSCSAQIEACFEP